MYIIGEKILEEKDSGVELYLSYEIMKLIQNAVKIDSDRIVNNFLYFL